MKKHSNSPEINDQLLLEKLPERIEWLDKTYNLFIYKYNKLWGVCYAVGSYFCKNDCAEQYDPVMIFDACDLNLKSAVEVVLARLKRISEQEKEMRFIK